MTIDTAFIQLNDVEINIYYEDTDFTGYVFHANYLKYLDRAREDLIGREFLLDLFQAGHHFVLSKVSMDFLRPAKFGDTLIVKTNAKISRSPRLIFEHEIHLKPGKTGAQAHKIISARLDLASIDGQGRPVRVPTRLGDQLRDSHQF